ncbi:3-keto-5-aminohexanoate cleavage enzyme [Roseovarius gaetbuli]|uniref:3-keto-5-aminohexanoate cleavage enzyme n=1 Tax=Roseovarius gaetbuli TaxID=1356575 RepID=A0A1X7A790_9RHOB|nr:3-keto-5-aminohexanoate cleavage protein [Roseovarius gaetbuli]SLN72277.1 3-keto-5-aminohexanoate cleavage enzyme [Roseovarius gaetbuli]
MQSKVIITAAVTGNIVKPEQHPELPITPGQIIQAVLDSEEAGAAIAHIHVRDPKTGSPSMDLGLYREVVDGIRTSGSKILINLTTGPGGRFVPTPGNPRVADAGSTLMPPEARVAHIAELKPDICTLDLNTMYSGNSVVINTPDNLRVMAGIIREAGVLPELECFDSGDLHLARDLLEEGTLDSPPLFQLVMGAKYGFNAAPETLLYARNLLPEAANWAAFGIGRMEFPVVAAAYIAGGHVRVGMEDNIYISRGRLTKGNGELVAKAKQLVTMLGGSVATPDDARQILGLANTA